MSKLERFYFTYGTDKSYPFQGGWTVVYAPNLKAAIQIFNAYHPDRDGCVNCAFYYTSYEFEITTEFQEGNFGAKCHEILGIYQMEVV